MKDVSYGSEPGDRPATEVSKLRDDVNALQGQVQEIIEQLKALDGQLWRGRTAMPDRGEAGKPSPAIGRLIASHEPGLHQRGLWPLQASSGMTDTQRMQEQLLTVEKDTKREMVLLSLDVKAKIGAVQDELAETKSALQVRHSQVRESVDKLAACQESARASHFDKLQQVERALRKDISRVHEDCEALRAITQEDLRKHLNDLQAAAEEQCRQVQEQQRRMIERFESLDGQFHAEAERSVQKNLAYHAATQEAVEQLRASVTAYKGQEQLARSDLREAQAAAFEKVEGTLRQAIGAIGEAATCADTKKPQWLENAFREEVGAVSAQYQASQAALRESVAMNEASIDSKIQQLRLDHDSLDGQHLELMESLKNFKLEVAKEFTHVASTLREVQGQTASSSCDCRAYVDAAVKEERGLTQAVLQHIVAHLKSEMESAALAKDEAHGTQPPLEAEVDVRWKELDARLKEVEVEVNVGRVVGELACTQDREDSKPAQETWAEITETLRDSLDYVMKEQQNSRAGIEFRFAEHKGCLEAQMQRFEAFLEEAGVPAQQHLEALEAEMRRGFAEVAEDSRAKPAALMDAQNADMNGGLSRRRHAELGNVNTQLSRLQASHGALATHFRDVKAQFADKLTVLDEEVRAIIERVLELREADFRFFNEELSKQRAEQDGQVAAACERVQALRQEVVELQHALRSIAPSDEAYAFASSAPVGTAVNSTGSAALEQYARGLFEKLEVFELDLSTALLELEGSVQHNMNSVCMEAESSPQDSDALQRQFACLREEMRGEIAEVVKAARTPSPAQTDMEEASRLQGDEPSFLADLSAI